MALEFGRPEYLYLLLALPVWWMLAWPWPGAGVVFARGEAARPVAGRWGAIGAVVFLAPRVLRTLTLVCLVGALAEPRRVDPVEERSLAGKAIGLAVDLSSSMLATDMDGDRSRIDVAREAAVRFAAGRTRDELSLVGFARDALTRVPPTEDNSVMIAGVESLEVQLVGDGTDISGALLATVSRMLESEREPRVVILLTDGAHNGTSVRPFAAARAAAAVGVRVHAISILPPENPDEAALRRVYYSTGGPMEEMRTVLGGIAEITGGQYFHAPTAAALDSIYAEIDRIEAPVEMVTMSESRHPLRTWFMLAGLLLLASESAIRGSRWGAIP